MSRFYDDGDDGEYPAHWWQIDLQRALTSGRGQRILRDILSALIAMPEYRLIEGQIASYHWDEDEDNKIGDDVCAIGAYAVYQEVKAGRSWQEALDDLAESHGDEQDDHWNTEALGRNLGLTRTVAVELAWLNDERFGGLTPEERWHAVFGWVWHQIKVEVTS